jgi:hypothetical protein
MSTITSENSDLTINASGSTSDIKFQANGVEKAVIDSSGNLGVGTASPSRKLHVQDSTDVTFKLEDTSTSSVLELEAGSNRGTIGTMSNHDLRFITNNAEAMRIQADGSLLVGTTDGGSSGAGDIVASAIFLGGNQAANELDDYEEGTWTPTGVGFTVAHIFRADYVKIGSQVTIQAYVTGSSGTSTQARINGLPFTAKSNGYSVGAINITAANPISAGLLIRVSASGTNFDFYKDNDQAVPGTSVDSGHIIFTATYVTDS